MGQQTRRLGIQVRARTFAVMCACIFVVIGLAAYFGVKAAVEPSVAAPSGLAVQVDDGVVHAAWNPVDGSDQYLLIREDGSVAYSGAQTTGTDVSATAGAERYQVIAVDDGHESDPSSESTVKVDDTWGYLSEFAAQFPQVIAPTPSKEGWQGGTCMPIVRADRAELGAGVTGSGRPMGKARIACNPSDRITVHFIWMVSKDAVNSSFEYLSNQSGVESVRWKCGTGYFDSDHSQLYLRVEFREDLFIGIGITDAREAELLDLANSLPIEE